MVVGATSALGGAGRCPVVVAVAPPGCTGALWEGAGADCAGAETELWAAAGSDGGWEPAGCGAAALSESSKPAVTIQFVLRMTLYLRFLQIHCSICQLEHNMYDRGGIHRLAIAQGRLEAHLVGCIDSGFIQSMAQAANNPVHMQLSV